MMIKNSLSARKIGLRLLILSLFTFPLFLHSEDKDEDLELPEVYIYGTYLGKMTFSRKKDFYPYLSKGNLFPLSRPLSPELRFSAHKRLPGETQQVMRYWLLLDAGAGNWWSDKVFLDCGLKNDRGLLSLRFTDFRRRNWAENHSKTDDFVRLKGAIGQENYYVSGRIFYDYDRIVRESGEPLDTFITQRGGIDFLTMYDFKPVTLTLYGDFSHNRFLNRFFGTMPGTSRPQPINETMYHYFIKYNNPLTFFDIIVSVNGESSNKSLGIWGSTATQTVTSFEVFLKSSLIEILEVAPGVNIFLEDGDVSFAPGVSLITVIQNLNVYPFLSYTEKHRINSIGSAYQKTPFIADAYRYTICKERNLSGGLEGRWNHLYCFVSYSHVEFENYPELGWQVGGSYRIMSSDKKKDILKGNIEIDIDQFSFGFDGSYTPQERVRYEPVSEFKLEVKHKGIPKLIPFAGLSSAFAIETSSDTVDIFSLNAGIEYQMLNNLALRLEVENIMDQRYEIWNGYTEGGVQFYASVKYKVLK